MHMSNADYDAKTIIRRRDSYLAGTRLIVCSSVCMERLGDEYLFFSHCARSRSDNHDNRQGTLQESLSISICLVEALCDDDSSDSNDENRKSASYAPE